MVLHARQMHANEMSCCCYAHRVSSGLPVRIQIYSRGVCSSRMCRKLQIVLCDPCLPSITCTVDTHTRHGYQNVVRCRTDCETYCCDALTSNNLKFIRLPFLAKKDRLLWPRQVQFPNLNCSICLIIYSACPGFH